MPTKPPLGPKTSGRPNEAKSPLSPKPVTSTIRSPSIENISQDQHGALSRSEQLDGSQEGEPDALPPDVDGLGIGRTARQFAQEDIRVRLEMDDFSQRRGRRKQRIGERPEVAGQYARRPALDLLEARICRDLVEPGAELRPALIPTKASPGPKEGFLDEVFSVVK